MLSREAAKHLSSETGETLRGCAAQGDSGKDMFRLKDYQQRALDTLRAYLRECARLGSADTAFYAVTREVFGAGIPYRPVRELPGLPYVCLRLPTGGGKTVVACHAVSVAAKDLLHADRCVVVWLVPSNAIREQTLKALRDRKHPYRQALESTLGAVTVMDVSEALYVQRATLDAETTLIVATMQAFRVQDTEGRKVYEPSGALMSHFGDVPREALADLDKHENGAPITSLANVLRLRRPVVIVDEAHNARTALSFDTLARFNPACIVEFTATPDTETNPSNVLHSVSAAELHAESMIKMPIRLETRPDWKELLADAVALRRNLETIGRAERQETGEYLRPIMLLQAQPRRKGQDTLTVDVVRQTLIDDHKIPEAHIARATGDENEIEGVDLADPKCDIHYVITVQALREGWDCPFAYVLCSVAEMKSSTAVEQILGRVMRLPNATRKARDELNRAYAFAASASFAAAANALTDALVENGFNRQEARDLITPMPSAQTELPLFDQPPVVTIALPEAPDLSHLPSDTAEKVMYNARNGELTFNGVMHDRDREALFQSVSSEAARAAVERAYRHLRGQAITPTGAPAERGEVFSIPVLAVRQGEFFEQFEETHFLEKPWELSKCDASLSEAEYASRRPEGQRGEISITATGRIEARFVSDLQQQMILLATDQGWTVGELVHWLDRAIPHPDIVPTESGLFLARLVRGLMEERDFTLEQLVHDKYRLKQAAAAKIDAHRQRAHREAYQALLLPDSETPMVVTPGVCFTYDTLSYPYNRLYQGGYHFDKHYYQQVGDLEAQGEEFECAQFIDSLPEVKFWVRNLERRPAHSFWLQTSTDRFYPDFVALLSDGRYLVLEYKGLDRWSNDDSKDKRAIGELWEARSKGRCLFLMPRGKDLEAIRAKIKA